jgi:predicted dehydrogenase
MDAGSTWVTQMGTYDCFRVGLIGYGVGKLYAAALRSISVYHDDLPAVELAAIATSSQTSAKKAVNDFGFERSTIHYEELLESDDISVLIIAAPNHLHHEMLSAALETDKAICIDKPLANNLPEARNLNQLSHQLKRDAQMIFQFRYCPAVTRAHQMITQGQLGNIQSFRWWHFRPSYVDPEKPLRWKGSFKKSGGGVLPDYAAHSIDMLIWLLGLPEQLTALTRIFETKRPPSKGSSERMSIDTEDHAIILAALPGGAIGTVEAGRMVTGVVNELGFEIFGSKGSLRWRAMNPNYLYFAGQGMEPRSKGWTAIPTVQQYTDTSLGISDLTVGAMRFYIAGFADFLRRTWEGESYDPNIDQGVKVQAVIEAALQSAGNKSDWQQVRYP